MGKEQNNLLRLDVMVKIETVSHAANGGIVSIAVLPFSKEGNEITQEPFYKVIDLMSCYMAGMDMNGCQKWWMEQSAKTISNLLMAKKELISKAIDELYGYLSFLSENHELVLWSRRMDYDFPKIEWCFNKFVEKKLPYLFKNKRDSRTWIKESGLDELQFEFEGVEHDALDSCRHQVKLLQASFNQLEPKKAVDHYEIADPTIAPKLSEK